MARLIAVWGALSLVLAGATQLRPETAFPIGAGEVLLISWILLVVFALLRGVPFTFGPTVRSLTLYWAATALVLLLGTLVALVNQRFMADETAYNTMAFLLAAVLSCLFNVRFDGLPDYHERFARLLFFLTAACTGSQLAAGLTLGSLGPLELWDGPRFTGWANNPNQLALYMVGMPFLGIYLMRRTRRLWRKLAHLLAIAVLVAVGLATQSDALRVAWAASAAGLGAYLWLRGLFWRRHRLLYVPYVIIPVAVVGVLVVADPGARIAQQVTQMYEDQGAQGSVRISLWLNGLRVMGESPLVGFGPGFYSGIGNPFSGQEAHNSYIDWGTNSGLLGIALHFALLAWAAVRILRARTHSLLGLLLALIVFSSFNLTFRQPLYWFLLALCLNLPRPSLPAAGVPAAPRPVAAASRSRTPWPAPAA